MGLVPNTQTVRSEASQGGDGGPEWALIVALDCEELRAAPLRLALAAMTSVEIGRGAVRAFRRDATRLRIDLADRSMSQQHARLSREGDDWFIEDAGSKNGTRVNGRRIAPPRAPLCDGDVIECGATFLVLRRALGAIRDLAAPVGVTSLLQTLSPSFERELTMLPKIARSRVAVLVRGDSGTGKEVMAQAIHALSGRKGAFTPVNCGAIPATLVESELFGSRRGAYSGAEDRPGLVRSAERGTFFLDEVAELPATSQSALLRVLQDGEVLPLGAGKATRVDVRIVSATHRPLEELVASGAFRRDLFARLRGYELHLPPLRARLEDLGLLCANLLARHEPGGPPRQLSRAAGRALFLHAWPFNVRELDHALQTAIAVGRSAEIAVEDLRLEESAAADAAPPRVDEREQIVELLNRHGGNVSAIARTLGTSRSQVSRLLARHGLDQTTYRR